MYIYTHTYILRMYICLCVCMYTYVYNLRIYSYAQAQQLQALAALKRAISNNEPLAQEPHASTHAASIRDTSPVNWTLLERSTATAKGELTTTYNYIHIILIYTAACYYTHIEVEGGHASNAPPLRPKASVFTTLYYYLYVLILLIVHYCFTGKSPVKWTNHQARHRSGRRRAFSSSLLDTTICDIPCVSYCYMYVLILVYMPVYI